MRDSFVLLCAKNHTHRRILSLMSPLLFSVVEIQVHLPYVGVSEAAQFEINNDQATQLAVKKE